MTTPTNEELAQACERAANAHDKTWYRADEYDRQQLGNDAEALRLAAAQLRAPGWTCFHCGETFTDWGAARNHFGWTPQDGAPVCRVDGGTASCIYHLKRRVEVLCEEGNQLRTELAKRAPALPPEVEAWYEAEKKLLNTPTCASTDEMFAAITRLKEQK